MEKIIKFLDIEIQKQTFHQNKGPNSIKAIDINKMVVSNRVPFGKTGFKCFADNKLAHLCIFLPKMSTY